MTSKAKYVVWIANMCFGLGWTYLCVVLFLGETLLGIQIRLVVLALPLVLGWWIICLTCRGLIRNQFLSETHLQNISITVFVSLICIVTADVVYEIFPKLHRLTNIAKADSNYYQLTEKYVGKGESPRLYYPTEKNFQFHKPNVRQTIERYGFFYSPELRDSPTLKKTVFRLRRVSVVVDSHGFRETTPLENANIFALGDSFSLGTTVDQKNTWVERLEEGIDQPIYNLGVNGLSPKQELMLLQYLINKKSNSLNIRHLLWMIYEGNDLEDTFDSVWSLDRQTFYTGTIIENILQFPYAVKKQALINKFIKGNIKFIHFGADLEFFDPFTVDGFSLVHPLYYSRTHGFRIFMRPFLERATKPQSYVMDHPHRPLLDQVFQDMASLSEKYKFKVTVISAPSASRLYAPYYDYFPKISDEQHFINYVVRLAQKMGFDSLNLYEYLELYSKEEMLYFPDDPHWNERGNEVVSQIIAEHLFSELPG